ncbi:hypothetical protein NKH98_12080 [Mesorhizobium sp. M0833]|uniref:hypothetical protein n=1 Tax=Mesorhizobium sp. M0833 TaxID=2957009 RepID=UPI003335BC04
MNAGFRIAYLDLVDDRRTGEAYRISPESTFARMISTNAVIFSSALRNLAFDGCSGATLEEPWGVSTRIRRGEPMLLCKFRSTPGGYIAHDSMKKRSDFLFGEPGCNS